LNATRRPITGGLLGRTQALAKAVCPRRRFAMGDLCLSYHQRFITTGASSPRGERLSSQTKNTSRTLSSAAAAEPVSSDQLGFVPDQRPKDDVPMANADDRKVSILWSPQNWSRLYVSYCIEARINHCGN
jgi:trimethyllysine dioxygenase